jgi:hypothetical protein
VVGISVVAAMAAVAAMVVVTVVAGNSDTGPRLFPVLRTSDIYNSLDVRQKDSFDRFRRRHGRS